MRWQYILLLRILCLQTTSAPANLFAVGIRVTESLAEYMRLNRYNTVVLYSVLGFCSMLHYPILDVPVS